MMCKFYPWTISRVVAGAKDSSPIATQKESSWGGLKNLKLFFPYELGQGGF